MTRKQMPMILMLVAGSVTALITYFRGYSLKNMSIALLATLVAFYFIGCIIKMMLDSFDKKNQAEKEAISEEGEVIEKDASSDNPTEESETTP